MIKGSTPSLPPPPPPRTVPRNMSIEEAVAIFSVLYMIKIINNFRPNATKKGFIMRIMRIRIRNSRSCVF